MRGGDDPADDDADGTVNEEVAEDADDDDVAEGRCGSASRLPAKELS